MPPPTFTDAVPADIPELVTLVQSAYRGGSDAAGWTTEAELIGGQRVDAAMLGEVLDRPDARVLVARIGLRLVACCELQQPTADGAAHLGMFAVDPALQGDGLGRRVLLEAERIVRDEWHAERLELSVIDVRDELVAWYRRRGYEPTGRYEPFPYGDERFGRPKRTDLRFAVLVKELGPTG